MRRHGREATRAKRCDTGALRFDSLPRLGRVTRRDELLLPGAHLQRKRALCRLGQHQLDRKAQPDLGVQAEPVEPACREHERVEAALARLAQPRLDVAAQRLDRDRRLEGEQLRLAPHRSRADSHPGAYFVGSDQRVAWVIALEIRTDREPFGVGRGHVLRRMDGDVDPSGEQRLLDLLHEDTALADLAERARAIAVACGRDRHERELMPRAPQDGAGKLGLREREPRAA